MTDTMTPARRELLRRMLEQRLSDAPYPRLPKRAGDGRVALTPAQAGIWFFTQAFPDSLEYNVFDLLRVPRMVSAAELRTSLRALVERHDALRLRITVHDGEPYQQAASPFDPDVTWFDLRELPDSEARARAEEIGNACATAHLPIEGTPLFRVSAIALPGDEVLIVLLVHHVITDYVTTVVLMEELSALLAGRELAPPPNVGFLDYAAWLREHTDQSRVDEELTYWRTKLGGELPVLDLPKDRPRTEQPSRRGHSTALDLPPDVVAGMRRLSEQERTTLFVPLLASYKVTVMRLAAQPDVIVGTALDGREHPDAERMVGCFVKTVALRTIVPPHASFRQVVRAAHQTVAEAHDHQTVPFERVVDAVGARRRLDVHPIYQTFFGFLGGREIRLGGAEINPIKLLDYDSAKWDMALSLWEDAGRIDGILECSADLVDPDTVTRFRDVFLTLCERLVAEPDAPVAVHPLVNDLERDRILLRLNDFEPTTIADATLAEPFVRQARRTPDAVAVEAGSRTLTYRELNEWANRLAHTLRELGAIRGEQVALLMDRSLECLVTVYAVAKSGATYVPLEPDLPDARLRFMLADIAPKLVVGQGVPEAISFAELDALAAGRPVLDPVNHGGGDNRSHLLYTSGSTGRPKAVACPVRTAVADILDIQGRLAYRPDDVILFKTSYGFDTSLWELFWPLYVGAKVVICPPGAEKDPDRLIEVIERHRVTVVDLTPTHLQAVLEAMRPGRCATLRYLHTGGERVTARLRDEVHAVFGDTVLINGYGPTETACVASTPLRRETGRTVPVGRPHRHVRIYVLDDQLNVQPIGVPGEAYVGSPVGITHGYHNRPELTAQRYLPDPFGPPGSRMYRTGDICRYLPDGMLEVLGRADSQVKIRGLRVELQEVEAVLLDHRDVAECAVLTIGDGIDRSLAAFVRPRAGATLDPAALHEHAARSLPPHMVPGGIQVIARIPMTVNGKTDRQALLAGWRTTPATARRAAAEPPATDLERQLAAIFAEVLVLPEVGVTDSFFELGGHSLRVFKLIAACETRLRLRPRVADVFAAPTVRDLADRLSSAPAPEPTCLVPLRPRPGRPLVVFVHASSGSALPFGDVASELGDDFSSYAMQSPEDGQFTVPRLAAIYVAEVDKVRGLSPVVIAGWSMGGCVAVEMARIWQERGIEVAAVAMLDTWPPPTTHADPERRARSRAAVLGLDVIAAEGLDVALGDRAAGELNRLRATIERNRTAFLDYTPAPFHGLVHLLRAAEQADKAFAALHPSEDYGWGELISEVVACELPGSHFSLLRKENARHLAVAIRAAFDSGTAYGEL